MSPGRELDALIAEKVMGWSPKCIMDEDGDVELWYDTGTGCIHSYGFRPSEDIAAAWQVAEKLNIAVVPLNGGRLWWAQAETEQSFDYNRDYDTWYERNISPEHDGLSESAPHAICLAALKAVGVQLE